MKSLDIFHMKSTQKPTFDPRATRFATEGPLEPLNNNLERKIPKVLWIFFLAFFT